MSDRCREPAFEPQSEAYTLFQRGLAFLREQHPAQASMLLSRALRLEPRKNSIREALGRAEFALGRHERAEELFRSIVSDVPDNDYAQYALGRCCLELERAHRGAGPPAAGPRPQARLGPVPPGPRRARLANFTRHLLRPSCLAALSLAGARASALGTVCPGERQGYVLGRVGTGRAELHHGQCLTRDPQS